MLFSKSAIFTFATIFFLFSLNSNANARIGSASDPDANYSKHIKTISNEDNQKFEKKLGNIQRNRKEYGAERSANIRDANERLKALTQNNKDSRVFGNAIRQDRKYDRR
ncbi:MAG: hypothetical protein CMP22_07475 [Rickettsiales bacterium]|nr:hypothetical protein [Rickettsiales bacterium]